MAFPELSFLVILPVQRIKRMKEGEISRMTLTFYLVQHMAVPFSKDTGGRSDWGAKSTIHQIRFEMPAQTFKCGFQVVGETDLDMNVMYRWSMET